MRAVDRVVQIISNVEERLGLDTSLSTDIGQSPTR